MSSMYHRLLNYDVKRTTKIDGMGPFNIFRHSQFFDSILEVFSIMFSSIRARMKYAKTELGKKLNSTTYTELILFTPDISEFDPSEEL